MVTVSAAPYLCLYVRWICLQHWEPLRFSDHRGINPSSISFSGIDFVATLSHSKTLGRDKKVQSRPVVVHGLAFIAVQDWLRAGWDLLKNMEDFRRDFLLPTPSSCLKGSLRSELRYDTGSALFCRTLGSIVLPGNVSLQLVVAHCWTPHSGRSFLLTCTASLGVEKSSRDFLGGWNAQGSERYVRVAKLREINMQITVLNAIKTPASDDPIAESESVREFVEFLQTAPLPEETKSSLVRTMEAKFLQCQPLWFIFLNFRMIPTFSRTSRIRTPFLRRSRSKRSVEGTLRFAQQSWKLILARSVPNYVRRCVRVLLLFLGWKRHPRTSPVGLMLCVAGYFDYLRYGYLGTTDPPVASFDCNLCGRNMENADNDEQQ